MNQREPYLVNKPVDRLTDTQYKRWEEAAERNGCENTEAFHKAVTNQWNRQNTNNIRY